MMRGAGFEPAQLLRHTPLKRMCLPIPPPAQYYPVSPITPALRAPSTCPSKLQCKRVLRITLLPITNIIEAEHDNFGKTPYLIEIHRNMPTLFAKICSLRSRNLLKFITFYIIYFY